MIEEGRLKSGQEIEVDAMDDIKEKAEYFRIGLMFGVHAVSDVVQWADSEIERQDKPPYFFIELSLMEHSGLKDCESRIAEI